MQRLQLRKRNQILDQRPQRPRHWYLQRHWRASPLHDPLLLLARLEAETVPETPRPGFMAWRRQLQQSGSRDKRQPEPVLRSTQPADYDAPTQYCQSLHGATGLFA